MPNISNLSFFSVSKYTHNNQHICDYREIPRPHYCMGFIFDGTGEFLFDSKSVKVEKGDIIFVPVGSTYISKWQGTKIMYISVHFSFEFNHPISASKEFEIQKVRVNKPATLQDLYLNMYKYKNEKFTPLACFYSILSRVYPLLKYSDTPHIDDRIKTAMDYIEHHSKDIIRIDSLAKFVNMSSSRFFTLFKECTGHSPIDYKNCVCVRNAELLLIDDNKKSIEEISEIVGFNSPEHFRKTFKKITGKTPAEYRKYSKSAEF